MKQGTLLNQLLPRSKRERMLVLMFVDLLVAAAAGELALFVRFDFSMAGIDPRYLTHYHMCLPLLLAITFLVYFFGKMYAIMWSQASIKEAVRIGYLNLLIMLLYLASFMAFQIQMPRSFFVLGFIAQTGLELCVRFSYRVVKILKGDAASLRFAGPRTMIIGAGDAGCQLGREIQVSDKTNGTLVCYIDDDPVKRKQVLNGVPILGSRYDIPRICEEENIEQIFLAIPTARPKDRAEILEICKMTEARIKVLPGMYQMINGDVSISKLRDVEIEDLLGREQVRVNMDEIAAYVRGKTVLVTGGGGSIGSELCRQIAAREPKLLIIFDIYENNAYDIQLELKKSYPGLHLETLIGSVRNTNRINQIMRDYRPDIVYHAAAHKHVPLMEDSPNEAIKNNVFGTYKTAQAAARYGVKRFVMISTDKAVNPTNIMGASKRMCEMIIQMMDVTYPNTDFVAVRFGNVLGSNGSVIPLFKKQIAAGGPVTVTHKDIIRYFMTIPEAVSLVLQAGYYAKGGEIFVLDMGEPVKILDLAEKMIRLSGYTPYEEIPIEFTGLRPGEKLYEEMLMKEEGMKETPNHMIHIGKPIEFDLATYKKQLDELYPLSLHEGNGDQVKQKVADIIGTYRPQFEKDPYRVNEEKREDSVPDQEIRVRSILPGTYSVHQAFSAIEAMNLGHDWQTGNFR